MKKSISYITIFLIIFLYGMSPVFPQENLSISSSDLEQDSSGEEFSVQSLKSKAVDSTTSPSSASSDTINQILNGKDKEIISELEASSEPFSLFNTPEDVKRLLSKEPKFIYDPKRLPDPMIIPWVRDQVLANEKLDKAKQLFTSKDYQSVLEICNDIIENHTEAVGIVNQANILLEKTKKEINDLKVRNIEVTKKGEDQIPKVELPGAIRTGTKGILFSKDGKAMVLLNNNILKVGEEVPDYKGVFIEEVKNTGEVIYRYKGVLFPVTVKTLQ